MPTTEETLRRLAALEQERLNHEKGKRIGARLALGALAFSIASSTFVWVHSARVAEQAKIDAVAEAQKAREESDAGLCKVLGLIIDSDTPGRTEVFREALREAYTVPNCQPPIEQRVKPTATARPTTSPD